ncbi:MAG: hypothetical protein J1F43_00455 [Muribaculaceae bacterium]|nr:hypothetical protein [Muribaculaceae bacterium]
MTQADWIKAQLKDDDFSFRLASLSQRHTGLPMVILIDTKLLDNKNTPRLLFNDSYENRWQWETLYPISIDKENPILLLGEPPHNLSGNSLSLLKTWIINHYDGLIKVWNGEIFQNEFIISITKQLRNLIVW